MVRSQRRSATGQAFGDRTGVRGANLPSEAEWECACRAGGNSAFYWGGEAVTNENGVCEGLGDYAWYNANSGGTAHPVGLKKPNPFGLYDMEGNVSETVQDLPDEVWLVADRRAVDPVMLRTVPGYNGSTDWYMSWGTGANITRGGSYWGPAAECRSASRTAPKAAWAFNGAPNGGAHIGFRVAIRLY